MSHEHDYPGYEPKIEGQIAIIPKEARFYLARLEDLVDVKKNLDRGMYPVSDYEGVPIETSRNSWNEPQGLRWGILKAIWGTRNILSDMGYQKEVEVFMKFQEPPKKKYVFGDQDG